MKENLKNNSNRLMSGILLVISFMIVYTTSGQVSDSSSETIKRAKLILEEKELSNTDKLQKITEVLDESSITEIDEQLEQDKILLPLLKLTDDTLNNCIEQSKKISLKQPFNQVNRILSKLIILEFKKHNGIPSGVLIDDVLFRTHLQGKMLEYNIHNKQYNNYFEVDIKSLKKSLLFIDDNVMRPGTQFHHYASETIVKGIKNVKRMIAEVENSKRENP